MSTDKKDDHGSPVKDAFGKVVTLAGMLAAVLAGLFVLELALPEVRNHGRGVLGGLKGVLTSLGDGMFDVGLAMSSFSMGLTQMLIRLAMTLLCGIVIYYAYQALKAKIEEKAKASSGGSGGGASHAPAAHPPAAAPAAAHAPAPHA